MSRPPRVLVLSVARRAVRAPEARASPDQGCDRQAQEDRHRVRDAEREGRGCGAVRPTCGVVVNVGVSSCGHRGRIRRASRAHARARGLLAPPRARVRGVMGVHQGPPRRLCPRRVRRAPRRRVPRAERRRHEMGPPVRAPEPAAAVLREARQGRPVDVLPQVRTPRSAPPCVPAALTCRSPPLCAG